MINIGDKFGYLTIVEIVNQSNGGGRFRARCICENVIDIEGYKLLKKHGRKSCGCMKHSRKALPVNIGDKFGNWTVLDKTPIRMHQQRYLLCKCDCGNVMKVQFRHMITRPSTNCNKCRDKSGDKNPRWRGGRCTDSCGYIRIYSPNNPNSRKNRYVYEHHMVMAAMIGRPIRKGETPHHKNGLRDDNRPENLELWSKSQPAGQRVSDRTAWAKEWLSIYEPEALVESLRMPSKLK